MESKPTYEELEDELRGLRAQAHLYQQLAEQRRARLAAREHTLVAIGFMSSRRCYLDVPREEAIDRYVRDEGGWPNGVWEPGYNTRAEIAQMVEEFTFTDEFGGYDVWPLYPGVGEDEPGPTIQ